MQNIMAENRTMDDIHKGLLKKYHTLCHTLGLSQSDKDAIVSSYGVDSSRDIDTHDLVDICAKLSQQANERSGTADMNKLRKRVMAAIGGWLRAEGKFSNASVIKGIACRATGHDDFNKIPRQRLLNLIAAFNNKTKDKAAVADLSTKQVITSADYPHMTVIINPNAIAEA